MLYKKYYIPSMRLITRVGRLITDIFHCMTFHIKSLKNTVIPSLVGNCGLASGGAPRYDTT